MTYAIEAQPLWQPNPQTVGQTRMAQFMRAEGYESYADLWQWSIDMPEVFWSSLWNYCSAVGEKGTKILVDRDKMPGARWFPEARLNYAENLLQQRDASEALVFWGEDKVKRRMSRSELYAEVARFQQFLIAAGVGEGDRVAGYLPNLPETLVAMLAATSLGAIWSSASPDFGIQGVLDRFGQIEPKVLICVDGYWYNGKPVDCLEKNAEVVAKMPSLLKMVVVPYLNASPALGNIANAVSWNDIPPANGKEVVFKRVGFDHPLFIMFSSGTTGVPKCIVHCHGGVLLQHLKEHQLHSDVRPDDRLFYFTTCGWMMWNWLVSGLACGATLLLYDGSPFAAKGRVLFDYAEAEKMTHFGTSAKFIDAAAKLGLTPGKTHDLTALRAMFSTGSPLSPEGFDWVYREIKQDILLASISGGTDIVSCFVLGNPVLPVYRGEIQCRGLGMAVDVFDDAGQPVRGEKGELVCTKPFPVIPVGFWNDPEGAKYKAAYFERFDNIWCHGDFSELTAHDGVIIYGRSDATLNPGGVRIGTAEIYRQVEQLPEVLESLVIGQAWPPGRNDDVRVVLFVRLREGDVLDAALIDRIKRQIRDSTTPRHVPAKVVQVQDIPRTKSGKIVELAVRNVVSEQPVKNVEALANPEALEFFRGRPELAD
ncbi:acetoacetate--CoA ligase [Ferribacterium limneticum]|uniref:acetoacetate--CoA ligase n=1 Tax=Ferribacterium limneticum TaxID=76259 RepID=UPI001CFBA0F7|nr:acetoacetate--CoA ligase [Ferribacterium limneticum]UCV28711.1 acetoacetate--CoA ligase [Ferribacterium limneticum]UCV32628.1 acetoacetate--CoA ligase [Ferribacterium limneticum]